MDLKASLSGGMMDGADCRPHEISGHERRDLYFAEAVKGVNGSAGPKYFEVSPE